MKLTDLFLAVAKARASLSGTNDTLNHLAHHRGQRRVYLRLTGQTVPAIYGPSADDQQFA